MNLLLDTHVALWAIDASPRLPATIRALIVDEANDVAVSAVSIWEIAIKFARARGRPNDMPFSGGRALAFFQEAGFSMLAVSPAHAVAVDHLPRLHDDPFDRLLVAQAMSEPLRFVTHDAQIAAYSDSVIYF